MKKTNVVRCLSLIILVCLTMTLVTSCAWASNKIKSIKGELIGNNFNIEFYDDFGNSIMAMEGKKVGMEANYVKIKDINPDGRTKLKYELSSVITMIVDGSQVAQTGNMVIFAEKGIKKLENFSLPSEITTDSKGTINIFDRNINKIKNILGTSKVIVVCSQLGVPIAVYGGKDVYWEIPEDLPKTTKLNVDGLALYIHRANYILLDSEMIQ